MKGRFHTYEGYHASKVSVGIRVFKLLSCKSVIITNAAGGLDPSFHVGDVMIITDHLNVHGMAGLNPLVGLNDDKFGPRFPPMSKAYNHELKQHALSIGKRLGFESFLRTGCYAYVMGPSY
eukprot:Colp12_sorted_trinity150504_noHs@12121